MGGLRGSVVWYEELAVLGCPTTASHQCVAPQAVVPRENSSFDQFNLLWHLAFVRLEEGKGETAVIGLSRVRE